MSNLVKLTKLTIKGIKNVNNGVIEFCDIKDAEMNNIIGIYGQNGTGKTAVIDATRLFKLLLNGKSIESNNINLISKFTEESSLEYEFYVVVNNCKFTITYHVDFKQEKDEIIINSEFLTYRNLDTKNSRTKKIYEIIDGKLIYKDIIRQITKKQLIEFETIQKFNRNTSYFFNSDSRSNFIKILKGKFDPNLASAIEELIHYCRTGIVIIDNDTQGTIMGNILPLNLRNNEEDGSFIYGELFISIINDSIISKDIYDKVIKKLVNNIDIVLNAFLPSIRLVIASETEELDERGNEIVIFKICTNRDGKLIPLKYESEGIKRLISVISVMTAAYNNQSFLLMIDEIDSGVYEYLLVELLKIFKEFGQGQLLFTSHNLAILEQLNYQSFVFSTTNPEKRYIKLSNVKSTNNLRNFYYNNILFKGQKEELATILKSHNIRDCLRKAGTVE